MATLLDKPQRKIQFYFRLKIVSAVNTSASHNRPVAVKCRDKEKINHPSKLDKKYS
jgi:hypothetical protein